MRVDYWPDRWVVTVKNRQDEAAVEPRFLFSEDQVELLLSKTIAKFELHRQKAQRKAESGWRAALGLPPKRKERERLQSMRLIAQGDESVLNMLIARGFCGVIEKAAK